MIKIRLLIVILFTSYEGIAAGQVRIRLFANQTPDFVVISVTEGSYNLNLYNGVVLEVSKNDPVVIAKYNNKLAIKIMGYEGTYCDSLVLAGKTGNDSFSLRVNGQRQFYEGDFQCFPDLNTLVLINISDIEKYISGVVMAEGGPGKNLEYFKTQAIIARTYMFRYFDKHKSDRFNVCDNTHCQAYNGLSSDSLLNEAALETKGMVILDKDSTLIIAAFHSNCGGETSSSEDVWLSGQPYLSGVTDPYCHDSRNANWQKVITRTNWLNFLTRNGFNENTENSAIFNFKQEKRLSEYRAGSFRLPLSTMRNDLNLRSTFFSVSAEGDSIILRGKGYGHGVGLCQEGAMVMASKGFSYRDIIGFYYSGVILSDIKNAVNLARKQASNISNASTF